MQYCVCVSCGDWRRIRGGVEKTGRRWRLGEGGGGVEEGAIAVAYQPATATAAAQQWRRRRGVIKDKLMDAIEGHVLGEAKLMAVF
uniref:Uncharacterized protein n=1 Tax=Oryza rufipogon TaxID=4529 RepID=A0A0E0QCY2_ORYRU